MRVIIQIISGTVVGLAFWAPLVILGVYRASYGTWRYPVTVGFFAGSIDGTGPIIIGIILAAIHGFVIGCILAAFDVRSLSRSVLVCAGMTIVGVAILIIGNWYLTRDHLTLANDRWFETIFRICILIVLSGIPASIPSVIIGMLAVKVASLLGVTKFPELH